MDARQLRTFAESCTAAWCSMDPAAIAAHYSPDGSLTINGGTPAVGRGELTAAAASSYEGLPDMQVYLEDLVVDGERIEFHADELIASSIDTYDADEYARQLAEGVQPTNLCSTRSFPEAFTEDRRQTTRRV